MPQPPRPLDHTKSIRDWWGMELQNWRKVRGLSTRALGAQVNLSATSIERIEKNERSCMAAMSAQLDAALQAGGALIRLWERVEQEARAGLNDADKASARPAPAVRIPADAGMLDDGEPPLADEGLLAVERRSFLVGGSLAAVLPAAFAGLRPKPGQTQLPSAVGRQDIEQIHAAAGTLAQWDNLYGGAGLVRESAIGQLSWARSLLTVQCPPQLRSELLTAVGRLAVVIGASAFDAFEHDDAANLFAFSTACAEDAGNWHLRARALNWRSRQAIWRGAPDIGLTYAESGLVRADRLSPREQAMLHNARARAFAKMGRIQDTLAAVGQSDEIFARAGAPDRIAWMAYYDSAQHWGDTGHALFDVAHLSPRSGRVAAERLTTATSGHGDGYLRSRALSRTKLATLTMGIGDPSEAVATAQKALSEVGGLRSKRALADVAALSDAARPFGRRPEVAELRRRIADVVAV